MFSSVGNIRKVFNYFNKSDSKQVNDISNLNNFDASSVSGDSECFVASNINIEVNNTVNPAVSPVSSHQSILSTNDSANVVFGVADSIEENKLLDSNRIYSEDREEYIKKVVKPEGVTVYAGLLCLGPYEVKLHSRASLLTCQRFDFIAKIKFKNHEKLDFKENFTTIKQKLLKIIVIIKILNDDLRSEMDLRFENFKQKLIKRQTNSLNDFTYAKDLLYLSMLLDKLGNRDPYDISLLNIIYNENNLSDDIRKSSMDLYDVEKSLRERDKTFVLCRSVKYEYRSIVDLVRSACEEGIKHHRSSLLAQCTTDSAVYRSIHTSITKLNNHQIFSINSRGINLFSDLISMLDQNMFTKFLVDLSKSFFEKVGGMSDPVQDVCLPRPVYFALCKSFQELILEVSQSVKVSSSDLFSSYSNDLKLINSTYTKWLACSTLNKSLDRQCKLIFKLMKHFEPGNITHSRFNYEFKLLDNFDVDCDVSEDRLVWMYLVDVASEDILSQDQLHLYKPLLQSFYDFILKTSDDCLEMLRVVCHNIVKYIAQTSTFTALSKLEIDRDIFVKQIEFINNLMRTVNFAFDELRDLIDVYNDYWRNRESIIEKIPGKFAYGIFKVNMEGIRKQLLNIVDLSLRKEVPVHVLVRYLRSFSEFLKDIARVDFSWYVKSSYNCQHVELINQNKNSYKIVDVDKFIGRQDLDVPRHYIIEIINILLINVISLINRSRWSDSECLIACSELLVALRKSLSYLAEQPDYLQYHVFLEESTQPFINALDDSVSHQDYIKRINIIGDSFWYLRKQDEIDIDKALSLYKLLNSDLDTDVLKNCYEQYLNLFNYCIENTIKMEHNGKIKFIKGKIKDEVKTVNVKNWSVELKREILPKILGQVAAVWSVQASKDIADSKKCLKPHCIQILCILNLISVDTKTKGVDKHLAQVLTGQGKSIVLGLLSCLLALTGHRVQTVCYSEYLADRDFQDFSDLFKILEINERIFYGTFDDMANGVIEPEVDGEKIGLRGLIEKRILGQSIEHRDKCYGKDISDSVLLIDEVDVFFTKEFYGTTYRPCTIIGFQAIAELQIELWDMIYDEEVIPDDATIFERLNKIISSKFIEGDDDFLEFGVFRNRPEQYYLVDQSNVPIEKKLYTNRMLFDEHLKRMIYYAKQVNCLSKQSDWYKKFKINDEGLIAYRNDDGLYCTNTFYGYYNTFFYLRFEKYEYDTKDFANFGYLNISCGRISYAKLPEKYPLILGVSGTLDNLYPHEAKAVSKSYGIKRTSSMPSFFGSSHLNFDSVLDFQCLNSQDSWLHAIYNQTDLKIKSGVSVLIFFNSILKINKFKLKYAERFERLNILTEKTESNIKNKYISDAGVSRTVTLCSRSFGRGIDFKSSVAVESNGGVHVIQTFFSSDIKEETQIKGRTCRRDNKGSYEMILCQSHLKEDKLIESLNVHVNYHLLNETREKMMTKMGSEVDGKIRDCEHDHKITLDLLDSFFKK